MKSFKIYKSATIPALALTVLVSGCASGPPEERPPLIADEDSSQSSSGGNGFTSGSASAGATASAEDQQRFRQALSDIQAGNLEKAEAELLALTQNSPGLAAAHNNLGVIYRRSGRFKEAEQQYNAALSANGDSRDAHLNLGILYDIYLQQPAKALEHYERYQQLSTEPDEDVALWITDLERRL